jgi:hypothetical protein
MMTAQVSKSDAKKPKKTKCAVCHEKRDPSSLTSHWQGIPISELKQLGLSAQSVNGNMATIWLCSLSCSERYEALRLSKLGFNGIPIHQIATDKYGRVIFQS